MDVRLAEAVGVRRHAGYREPAFQVEDEGMSAPVFDARKMHERFGVEIDAVERGPARFVVGAERERQRSPRGGYRVAPAAGDGVAALGAAAAAVG